MGKLRANQCPRLLVTRIARISKGVRLLIRQFRRTQDSLAGSAAQTQLAGLASDHVGPFDQLKRAVAIFHDGRAAFDPVASVDVVDAQAVMHVGEVDVATNYAI